MAAFSTSIQKLGINGGITMADAALLSGSSATSQITITCGALENVYVVGYNNTTIADVTLTLLASTAEGYASKGRGSLVLTTSLEGAGWYFGNQFESNWFQSTANKFVITASTALTLFAFEMSSTRKI
jgi:hypothetical protein